MESSNPYESLLQSLTIEGHSYNYYSLKGLNDPRLEKLPFSIRILLECAIRKCDNFNFKKTDVEKILNWSQTSKQDVEIPFKPSRVILQDFTGVPCVVDLATMREAMLQLGGDPQRINPECPVDLVIDHSIQVDASRTLDAKDHNEALEFERNKERFSFLKWGQKNFSNFSAFPPGSGIVHQVNLEYIAPVVFETKGMLYPDSLVGTDSHTTMINGLGVVGWGVGGIEAESVMMGQNIAMVLPEVVGFKLVGELPKTSTATDLVLTCTEMLRKRKVVGKFVEFFGPGVNTLSLADRATISNMAPEYGATIGYFPVDRKTIDYLRQTGRDEKKIAIIEKYLETQGLLRTYTGEQVDPEFSGALLELDLSTVVPCLAGPKRPHDRVAASDLKKEFVAGLNAPTSFKAYGLAAGKEKEEHVISFKGENYTLRHGSVVLAAITSCTNTSNPGVMLAAGMLAKNAVEKGLKVAPYIKTSLSPGSGVVSKYFEEAGLTPFFNALGFNLAGYGCMTCIGNSGELDAEVGEAITKSDLVVSSVLSGNRNFEGRVHPLVRANYLASPPLVVAYALAGTTIFDFETDRLGVDKNGNDVFLRDIWPSRCQVEELEKQTLKPQMFIDNYQKIATGNARWNALEIPEGNLYKWPQSTYIHKAPFFDGMTKDLPKIHDIVNGNIFAIFGDSITTDHISPAGNIAKNSPAGRYLLKNNVDVKDFNTYGSRRGHDEVMARGTFANIRIINKMIPGNKVGPQTIHVPSGETLDFFDAAERYMKEGIPTVILGGNDYGCGSSRDWAAKGPWLQGVKAVIAQSFERIHRSNLVGMGILPLEFKNGESAESLGLTGNEQLTILLSEGNLKINQDLEVTTKCGKKFVTKVRLDTDPEIAYFKNGGILNYVIRKIASQK